jgi:hypothetical protein
MLNCAPLKLTADRVTLLDPPLVKTTTSVSVCPTGTAPKLTLHGAQVSCCVDVRAHNGSANSTTLIMTSKKTRIEKDWGTDWGSLMPFSLEFARFFV